MLIIYNVPKLGDYRMVMTLICSLCTVRFHKVQVINHASELFIGCESLTIDTYGHDRRNVDSGWVTLC